MFGNKNLMKRVMRAVEPALEPGEDLVVPVYLHSYRGSGLSALLGSPAKNIKTWIVALTSRRVLVYEGDTMNVAKSVLLGDVPREAVTVEPEGSRDKPTHLTFHFSGDDGHRFAVPLVWRNEAARLVTELAT
jgi:hypothetical protein